MKQARQLHIDHIETPIGLLAVVVDIAGHLRAAGWTDGHARMERLLRDERGARPIPARDPGGVSTAVRAYFAGDLRGIERLPLSFDAGTEFQLRVWQALREIPCGETCSYGQLARRIGSPTAVRAVGLANGANPIGIVVPCHRVIGADGSLTGYGGGVERKRWLLEHERRITGRAERASGAKGKLGQVPLF
jgi:methylated-DNA-[protein]-cysteine S-methyltransferase